MTHKSPQQVYEDYKRVVVELKESQARIKDLEHKLGMVAAYLKDMTERGDDEAKALLDGLDLDYEYDDEP
jgi:CRISPR/Cas system-associated exonuclease Cas4 (RecB family)